MQDVRLSQKTPHLGIASTDYLRIKKTSEKENPSIRRSISSSILSASCPSIARIDHAELTLDNLNKRKVGNLAAYSSGSSLDSLFQGSDSVYYPRSPRVGSSRASCFSKGNSYKEAIISNGLQREENQSIYKVTFIALNSLSRSQKGSPNVSRNSSLGVLEQGEVSVNSLRPPPLDIGSGSPQTPKTYAMQATGIRERRTVFNFEGEACRISDEKSAKRGQFSCVYDLIDPFPRIHPDVSNENVVVKVLQDKHIQKATKYISHSIEQYKSLNEFFKDEESPPIVKVYNPETAAFSGYTLLEKVRPLDKAPWDENTRVDELGNEGRKALSSIDKLIRTNIPLDLKWNNLGVKKDGTVALLDYDNLPFALEITDSYSRRLSEGNPYVYRHIKELEDKVQLK